MPHTASVTEPQGDSSQSVKIEAFDGPGKGAVAVLTSTPLVLGSDPECDLILLDPTVSRRHLSIERSADAVVVHDLGSRNGVKYLGAKIRDGRVPLGGSITIGRTKVRFLATAERDAEEADAPGELIGRSSVMRRLFAQLHRLSRAESGVLFEGETGTGKEAVARALHGLSPRAAGPFVAFDCASASPALIESDLFGHVKGAFSGATHTRVGVFEHAAGGTLLLDGIDELPLDLQPKLLRALDARELRPVGGQATVPITCRVLASSAKDLRTEIKARRFREDLYFRIAVTTLVVPPLRDRAEDIPPLVLAFAKGTVGIDVALAPATLAAFQCDRWPGNVRELRNAVQSTLALGTTIDAEGEHAPRPASYAAARDKMLGRFERDYLAALLGSCKRNVTAAAKEARLSRRQLYRLLSRHGLVPRDQR